MRVLRIRDESAFKLVVAHENITARRLAEEKLKVRTQELGERVLELNLNEDRLESLLQLSQTAHRLSETEIVHEALEYAVRLTNSQIGYLHFVNPDQKTIQLVTWSDKTLEQCSMVYASHYPLDEAGIWADCVRLAKPVVHNDYQNLLDKKGYPDGHAHLLRHASIPVYDGGKIQIILGVGNKKTNYSSVDVLQMSLIGDQLVKILNRKRAEDALRDANLQLEKRLAEIEILPTERAGCT
jgi:two-component system sensor histidine kinase/response regulator